MTRFDLICITSVWLIDIDVLCTFNVRCFVLVNNGLQTCITCLSLINLLTSSDEPLRQIICLIFSVFTTCGNPYFTLVVNIDFGGCVRDDNILIHYMSLHMFSTSTYTHHPAQHMPSLPIKLCLTCYVKSNLIIYIGSYDHV